MNDLTYGYVMQRDFIWQQPDEEEREEEEDEESTSSLPVGWDEYLLGTQ